MVMVLELPAVIPGGEALPKRPTPWVLFYALPHSKYICVRLVHKKRPGFTGPFW
jgi:hypothetical protein